MGEVAGCEYREHKGVPQCNKMCDAGETMCPHHLLLTQTKAQAKADKRKPPARAAKKRSRPAPRNTTPSAYQQ